MITKKYYCDWCGKEMSKLFYYIGSHIVIFGRYNYDETAIKDNEDSICIECYSDFIELRRTKKEIFPKVTLPEGSAEFVDKVIADTEKRLKE